MPRSMALEALSSGLAGARTSIQLSKALCFREKRPWNIPHSPLLVRYHWKKTDIIVVRDKPSPQKPHGSRLGFWRTRVQHTLGSSTIELPSTLAESSAYLSDRACHGTLEHAAARSTRLSATVSHPMSLRRAPSWRWE